MNGHSDSRTYGLPINEPELHFVNWSEPRLVEGIRTNSNANTPTDYENSKRRDKRQRRLRTTNPMCTSSIMTNSGGR